MNPPINIGGDTVEAITIDGTSVSEVTVDGSTVFGGIPDSAIDDFESDSNGSQPQNWDSQFGQVTNQRSFSGSLSYETTSATDIPDLDYILGVDVSKTTDGVVWQSHLYESTNSGGGAWRFKDPNGNEITTSGLTNPGQSSRYATGTDTNSSNVSTDVWVFHEVTFDFTNNTFDVFFERQDTGDAYSSTGLGFVNSASEIGRVELIRDSGLGQGANLREDYYTDDAGFTS